MTQVDPRDSANVNLPKETYPGGPTPPTPVQEQNAVEQNEFYTAVGENAIESRTMFAPINLLDNTLTIGTVADGIQALRVPNANIIDDPLAAGAPTAIGSEDYSTWTANQGSQAWSLAPIGTDPAINDSRGFAMTQLEDNNGSSGVGGYTSRTLDLTSLTAVGEIVTYQTEILKSSLTKPVLLNIFTTVANFNAQLYWRVNSDGSIFSLVDVEGILQAGKTVTSVDTGGTWLISIPVVRPAGKPLWNYTILTVVNGNDGSGFSSTATGSVIVSGLSKSAVGSGKLLVTSGAIEDAPDFTGHTFVKGETMEYNKTSFKVNPRASGHSVALMNFDPADFRPGDVALAIGAGQSNMAGVAGAGPASAPNVKVMKAGTRVFSTYSQSDNAVYQTTRATDVSPMVEMARVWQARIDASEALPDLYYVNVSRGGSGFDPTSNLNTWNPDLPLDSTSAIKMPEEGVFNDDTRSQFYLLEECIIAAVKEILSLGKRPVFLGTIWSQWEQDSTNSTSATSHMSYMRRLRKMIDEAVGVQDAPFHFLYPRSPAGSYATNRPIVQAGFDNFLQSEKNVYKIDVIEDPNWDGLLTGNMGVFNGDTIHYTQSNFNWQATKFLEVAMDAIGQNVTGHITESEAIYAISAEDSNTEEAIVVTAVSTLVIPEDAVINFKIGYTKEFISDTASNVTVSVGLGVSLNGVVNGTQTIGTRYTSATVRKVGPDAWIITGDYS